MRISRASSITSFLIAVVLAVFVNLGCNKTNVPSNINNSSNTITAVLASASDATTYTSLIQRVHLDTVFSGMGPYTVFVPTNDAFTASGLTSTVLAGLSDST